MATEKKKDKYIHQCFSAVHTKQTCAVECFLSGINDSDDIPPLILHNGYSRFRFGIIDNSNPEARKILAANILSSELPYLLQQYDLAVMTKHQRSSAQGADEPGEEEVSPAYTVVIPIGQFKGKTPAEWLLEDPSKASALDRTAKWFEENLSKYPGNKKAISAIEDALFLLNQGELKPQTGVAKPRNGMSIFREDYKVMAHPESTKRVCVKVEFYCDFEASNPWSIHIENNVCPMVAGTVDRTTVLEHCATTMAFNDKEFAALMWSLRSMQTMFEQSCYPAAVRYVNEHMWRPSN